MKNKNYIQTATFVKADTYTDFKILTVKKKLVNFKSFSNACLSLYTTNAHFRNLIDLQVKSEA